MTLFDFHYVQWRERIEAFFKQIYIYSTLRIKKIERLTIIKRYSVFLFASSSWLTLCINNINSDWLCYFFWLYYVNEMCIPPFFKDIHPGLFNRMWSR